MKKVLTCLLALTLVLTCVFAMTACGEQEEPKKESEAEDTSSTEETVSTPKEYVLAEGYKPFGTSALSFAYPKDWTLTDSDNPVMADDQGNSVNLVSETANDQNTELYTSLSQDTFMELMGNVFEAMGMDIGTYSVEKKTNDQGVEMVVCTYSLTYQEIEMTMTQFILVGEKNHYTITVTAVADIDEVTAEVFKSITLK